MKCQSKVNCTTCGKQHHGLLHDQNLNRNDEMGPNTGSTTESPDSGSQTNDTATNLIPTGSTNVKTNERNNENQSPVMVIVPVTVKGRNSKVMVNTYAFIDNSSGAVFCNPELQQQLNTHSKKTRLIIKTLNLYSDCS